MPANQVIVAARSFGRTDPTGAEMLKKAGLDLVYLSGTKPAHDELCELMSQPHTVAVVAGAEPITAEMIHASPSLKVIGMHGVGLNHIDVKYAKEHGVQVLAVPGGNAESVADLTWALMFAVSRHIVEADSIVRQGKWPSIIGTYVYDKTLSILGFGAIGQAVAKRAAGFSMRVLAYDVVQNEAAAKMLGAQYVSLDDLITQADYLTLHVPLLPETRNLIGERELAMMKPSAFLINVSRGGVVDETALCAALEKRIIAGAGVDVLSEEPVKLDQPLLKAPNCVLSPHMGAHSIETIRHIGIETAKNILSVLQTA